MQVEMQAEIQAVEVPGSLQRALQPPGQDLVWHALRVVRHPTHALFAGGKNSLAALISLKNNKEMHFSLFDYPVHQILEGLSIASSC